MRQIERPLMRQSIGNGLLILCICRVALMPSRKQSSFLKRRCFISFSARGHDMAQVLLGLELDHPRDAICGYYRSRPILLSLGVDPLEALGSSMARAGGYSDGRDIGAVFNFPNLNGPSALPMCGGVGAQYTPMAGWAQALQYFKTTLKDPSYDRAIGVVLGGEASVATNGFWSALTIATTLKLPMLFYVEDNGYGISTPSHFQTPGANIAANLEKFKNLKVLSGDGTDPAEAATLIGEAVHHVRSWEGPSLLRLTVPRLQGHSFQDTQTYKSDALVKKEWARDPLPKLKDHLVPAMMSESEWKAIVARADAAVEETREKAESLPVADPSTVMRYVYSEAEPQIMGGLRGNKTLPSGDMTPNPQGSRINMVTGGAAHPRS